MTADWRCAASERSPYDGVRSDNSTVSCAVLFDSVGRTAVSDKLKILGFDG
jgi:hypothetical protein